MALPPTTRDFIGYGEHPPEFLWPNKSRVAVSLVINIEDGAERSTARGDAVDDLGAHWVPHTVQAGVRNRDLESAFEYGSRAGIWRLLRTLRKHDAVATAFCCAVALEKNPAIADALVKDGHEIADHGLLWDTHTDKTPEQERELIVRSRDVIERLTGLRATTWYSRDGINPETRAFLAEQGFSYDSNSFNDDLPHLGADATGLPILPYAGDTNDSGLIRQFPTAASFADHLTGTLEMLLDDTRSGSSVLSVGLHPRLIGRPSYIGALDRFLTEVSDSGAWVATRNQIIAAWQGALGD